MTVKQLSLLVAVDEDAFGAAVREKLACLEEDFKQRAEATECRARQLMAGGDESGAKALLSALTEECTEQLYALSKAESRRIADEIRALGGVYGRQSEELQKYADYAEFDLLSV